MIANRKNKLVIRFMLINKLMQVKQEVKCKF